MGKISDAVQNLLAAALHRDGEFTALIIEREAAKPHQEKAKKSLRDSAQFGDNSFGVSVVSSPSKNGSFFRKSNVETLWRYAEYSVWVRAAIDIYRNAVTDAELQLRAKDKTKPVKKTVDKLLKELLQKPNQTGISYAALKAIMVEDYLVVGHGALELVLRRDLIPMEIRKFDASRLGFQKNWDGTDRRQPRYAELSKSTGRVSRYLADEQIMLLKNRERSYDVLGLSHVEALDIAVRGLLSGDERLIKDISEPTAEGMLYLGDTVGPRQVDEVRAQIQAVKHKFLVAGGAENPEFINFGATAEQLKILDSQTWFVRQVAAIFKVSTAALRLAVDTSRANTAEMFENDKEGVGAVLKLIRDIENRTLVSRFDYLGEHNLEIAYPVLSRKDEKKQAEISRIFFNSKPFASYNEVRAMNNLPELDPKTYEFANEPIVQVGSIPVPMSIWQEQIKSFKLPAIGSGKNDSDSGSDDIQDDENGNRQTEDQEQ